MKRTSIGLVFALLIVFNAFCDADVIYTISLDTGSLAGNTNGPFALDFQLTSGDTSSGVVNTAALSQFVFSSGGGAGSSRPFPNSGNASGDLSSIVSLSTSGTFFSEFSQYFTPGSSLSFQIDLSNNVQPGATPDELTFQLIDKTGAEVPTTDPSGSNSLLIADLIGTSLLPQTYATTGDGVTVNPL